MESTSDVFSSDLAGSPEAGATELVRLQRGGRFALTVEPVVNRVAGAPVRMLAYNRSVPGPTLRVDEGAEVVIDIANRGELETTVHWHGLRLDHRYDGTDLTQHPIEVGGSYEARVTFPDPGVYWYHPHIRTDYGLEMGLYGRAVVDVLFAQAGSLTLEHRTPDRTYPLATITVTGDPAPPLPGAAFEELRTNDEMVALRARIKRYVGAPPDKILVLTAVMDFAPPGGADVVLYSCPMHPEVVSDTPGHCPKCAMKLLPAQSNGQLTGDSPHGDQSGHQHATAATPHETLHPPHHEAPHASHHESPHGEGHGHGHGAEDGIEWEDDMVEVNRITTRANMKWKIVPRPLDGALPHRRAPRERHDVRLPGHRLTAPPAEAYAPEDIGSLLMGSDRR